MWNLVVLLNTWSGLNFMDPLTYPGRKMTLFNYIFLHCNQHYRACCLNSTPISLFKINLGTWCCHFSKWIEKALTSTLILCVCVVEGPGKTLRGVIHTASTSHSCLNEWRSTHFKNQVANSHLLYIPFVMRRVSFYQDTLAASKRTPYQMT